MQHFTMYFCYMQHISVRIAAEERLHLALQHPAQSRACVAAARVSDSVGYATSIRLSKLLKIRRPLS